MTESRCSSASDSASPTASITQIAHDVRGCIAALTALLHGLPRMDTADQTKALGMLHEECAKLVVVAEALETLR